MKKLFWIVKFIVKRQFNKRGRWRASHNFPTMSKEEKRTIIRWARELNKF